MNYFKNSILNLVELCNNVIAINISKKRYLKNSVFNLNKCCLYFSNECFLFG